MKKYQYQIIRYIHDYFTGEFVNVGLICFEPNSSFLKCKVINRYSRISNFFLITNGHYLLSSLRQIESQINKIGEELTDHNKEFKNLDEITASVLPKDDSALKCTEVKNAIDININKAFDDLYCQLIEKYIDEPESNQHSDNYAWKNYYKKYFEQNGITKNFTKHSIKTHTDTINFDKSWKNGVWNCYQSLSLDLSRTEAIKNKIYRWSGILKQLETTKENMHLYFLTASPKKEHDLSKFIEEAFAIKSEHIEVTLIKEKDAEKFAQQVKEEMETHIKW